MNLNLDRYKAGSAFYVRTIYLRGGRNFRVFDHSVRWRLAARRMRAAGLPPYEIARLLGRRRDLVDRALSFGGWPF